MPEAQPERTIPGDGLDMDPADRRVVVLDDDPAILSNISFLPQGCDVTVAEDRQQHWKPSSSGPV